VACKRDEAQSIDAVTVNSGQHRVVTGNECRALVRKRVRIAMVAQTMFIEMCKEVCDINRRISHCIEVQI